MSYIINDKIYERIKDKFYKGNFSKGNYSGLNKRYFENVTISNFPISQRTPEICSSLMDYNNCKFNEVPESSRTRSFFIENFNNKDVNEYIKAHITEFDRQFFKDLIETNDYATHFNTNCFTIMPKEFIDEEMCSLAIMTSLDWSDFEWFYAVYKRKPKALTEDIWKLGARLYGNARGGVNKVLNITPEEYKDEEYYKEMLSCNFNCGLELNYGGTTKGKIMDSIPEEVLTENLLINLLKEEPKNILRFNEHALETKIISLNKKIWQYALDLDGSLIYHIPFNDERVEYFLKYYEKDTWEYKYCFKDKYNMYRREKKVTIPKNILFKEVLQKLNLNEINNVDKLFNLRLPDDCVLIPIKNMCEVPNEHNKKYDSEEYLKMLYELSGMQILMECDELFYMAKLPEGWTVVTDGCQRNIKDANGNAVFGFIIDDNFHSTKAYVWSYNIPKDQLNKETDKKVILKK